MNPLVETIQITNPDYSGPPEIGKNNRIYMMQFPAYIKLAESGDYPYAVFIGQTDPARGWIVEGKFLVRWGDRDYSKCPEKPQLLQYTDVHPDISDNDIRQLMRKYGWVKELSDYPGYGSHEMIMHPTIKDWDKAILQMMTEAKKEDDYYIDFQRKYDKSPARKEGKDKKKVDEIYRIPNREFLMDMCDGILKYVEKDAKIYVTKDAHGRICDYLISKGYTNLYTEKSYKYFPKGDIAISSGLNVVTLLTDNQIENMYFDVSLGNPPYSDRSQTNCADVGGSGKSLDDKFTLKCMTLSKRVKLIIRAKELSKVNSKFKQQLFAGNRLRSITYVDKSTFPTIQNTVTCVIDWDCKYCGETVITYEDGTVVSKLLTKDSVIKLNNPNYVASVDDNMMYRYLRGKIPRHQINDNDGTRIVEIMGKGETPIIRNTLSTPTIGLNEYGVIMNYNSRWEGFDKMSVKESDTCLSESMIMLKTKSDEESLRLIEYLKSDEIVTLMKGLKSGFSNSARIFEMIPDMV